MLREIPAAESPEQFDAVLFNLDFESHDVLVDNTNGKDGGRKRELRYKDGLIPVPSPLFANVAYLQRESS